MGAAEGGRGVEVVRARLWEQSVGGICWCGRLGSAVVWIARCVGGSSNDGICALGCECLLGLICVAAPFTVGLAQLSFGSRNRGSSATAFELDMADVDVDACLIALVPRDVELVGCRLAIDVGSSLATQAE